MSKQVSINATVKLEHFRNIFKTTISEYATDMFLHFLVEEC